MKLNIDDKFNQEKLCKIIYYIINFTNIHSCNIYDLFKIMYLFDKDHIKYYGSSVLYDDFIASDFGPIPWLTYQEIKKLKKKKETFFNNWFIFDSPLNLRLLHFNFNLDNYSDSEIKILNKILSNKIDKNEYFDSNWKFYIENYPYCEIPKIKIAESCFTLNDKFLEYVKLQFENDIFEEITNEDINI